MCCGNFAQDDPDQAVYASGCDAVDNKDDVENGGFEALGCCWSGYQDSLSTGAKKRGWKVDHVRDSTSDETSWDGQR